MILPHGGKLVERILAEEAKCEFLEEAHSPSQDRPRTPNP